MTIHSSAIRLNGLLIIRRSFLSFPMHSIAFRIEWQGVILSTWGVSFIHFTYRWERCWRLAIWRTICLRISDFFHISVRNREQKKKRQGDQGKDLYSRKSLVRRASAFRDQSMVQMPIVYLRKHAVTGGRWRRHRKGKFTLASFNIKFASQLIVIRRDQILLTWYGDIWSPFLRLLVDDLNMFMIRSCENYIISAWRDCWNNPSVLRFKRKWCTILVRKLKGEWPLKHALHDVFRWNTRKWLLLSFSLIAAPLHPKVSQSWSGWSARHSRALNTYAALQHHDYKRLEVAGILSTYQHVQHATVSDIIIDTSCGKDCRGQCRKKLGNELLLSILHWPRFWLWPWRKQCRWTSHSDNFTVYDGSPLITVGTKTEVCVG